MESLSQVFTPQLLAIQNQDWDWADGWSGADVHNSHVNKGAECEAVSSACAGEDFSKVLPDELLEKVFASLPIIYIFRAGAVCRRWNAISSSRRFLRLCRQREPSGPWYFMSKESQNGEGLVYNPSAKKWYTFSLPLIERSVWFAASSKGLVCFVDNSFGYVLYVCNLMTRTWTKLPEPHQKWSSDYYAVSMTCDRGNVQSAVIARSSQLPNDYSRWSLSIEACNSLTQSWQTVANTVLRGWRGGENSVICNGIFYCVIHSTAMVGSINDECRLGLLSYELASRKLRVDTMPMPCPLTCVKLINCNDRLTMVGGIGKSDVVRGIGIWELASEWREISRMPNKFFRGFGEFDDVFSSSGADDLIYIHAFGSPQLLLFNVQQQTWRWSQKCPMVKKHPLHLFTGFCFEPNLDVSPWSS
ncbi:hypothetical protein L7F22_028807 [Adiantum nelumboides]|nr:hypothetical protein [Adiantum nelumboides]